MKKFILALDFDGVVTRHPDHLRFISDRILMSGGEVHVVTGRMEKERSRTLRELKGLRFRFTELHMYPGECEYKGDKLGVEDMQGIAEVKQNVLEDIGAALFLDDNLHYYMLDFPCPVVHI